MTAARLREIQPVASDIEWKTWIDETRQALKANERSAVVGVHSSIRQMNAEITRQGNRRAQAELSARRAHHLAVFSGFDANIAKLQARLVELIDLLRTNHPQENIQQIAAVLVIDIDHATRAAYVRVMITQCVWVIRNMAFPRHGFPAEYRSSMPEPIRDYWDSYNSKDVPLITRQRPNSRQITEADRVLPWFFFVTDGNDRSALWLRHIPLSWRKIGDIMHRSHTWAVQAEGRAVDQIIRHMESDLRSS